MFTFLRSRSTWRAACAGLLLGLSGPIGAPGASAFGADDPVPVDFERQIRPLLATRCFPCHAEQEKKGGLSLADRDSLVRGGKSGAAIDLEDAGGSLLLEKVSGADPAGLMPPRGKGQSLSASEVALFRDWIAQGARWPGGPITAEAAIRAAAADHWAFRPPTRADLPMSARGHAHWVRNPIDAFVLERLERAGLEPNPEADRPTLLRRLALDLVGLPPTPEEVAEYVADIRPDAYERQVDRLLANPRYGERWGRRWLPVRLARRSHGQHGHRLARAHTQLRTMPQS